MSRLPTLICTALLSLHVVTVSVMAQSQEQVVLPIDVDQKPIAQEVKTQQVEVIAKSAVENSRKDAAGKTIVSNAELMRFGDSNIIDALKRVPGIIASKDGVQLQGLNASYTQVLVDGNVQGGVRISDISINRIDRVEIYRLGSAEFSSQAIGGTINIILKKIPNNSSQQIKANIRKSYVSESRFEWMGSDKRDNLSYSLSIKADDLHNSEYIAPHILTYKTLNAQNQVVQNYRTSDISKDHLKGLSFFPMLQYKGADGLSVQSKTILLFARGDSARDLGYDFFVGSRFPVELSRSTEHNELNLTKTSLKISDTILQNVKLNFDLGLGVVTNDIITKESNYQGASLLFNRLTTSEFIRKNVNSSLKVTIPSTGEEHDIVAGWNGSTKQSIDSRMQITDFLTSNSFSEDQSTHSQVDNIAFFVQDEWRFRKASSAYFGLRWESLDVRSDGRQQLPVQNVSRVWSPIIQTVWQLDPENTDRLRFGVSRTYKAPTDTYLTTPKFSGTNNSIERPNFIGNPSLRPELAWSLQAAYEHNGVDEWEYNVRAVARKIENLQLRNLSFSENQWFEQFVNSGNAISKLIEIDTKFPLKRFFSDAPDVNFMFYVSKNWSSVSSLPNPENRLTPETVSMNTSIDYKGKDIPLGLGISLVYKDGKPYLENIKKRAIFGATTDLDVYAFWRMDKKTQFRLAVNNVLKRMRPKEFQIFDAGLTTIQTTSNQPYRSVALNFEHNF